MNLQLEVNGKTVVREVEPRLLLSDFLRDELGLTGTHVGCEQGVCGACTIQIDGTPVRSCLMLAVQAGGRSVRTVEAMTEGLPAGELHPLQEAFRAEHALQCGFCTAGFLMSLEPLLADKDALVDEESVRAAISGNICRCTGYQNIVAAVLAAASEQASRSFPD